MSSHAGSSPVSGAKAHAEPGASVPRSEDLRGAGNGERSNGSAWCSRH